MSEAKKVLVIDDEENVCTLVKRIFEMDKEFDFKVTTVDDVEKALSILKEDSEKAGRFDVVVIDLGLGSEKKVRGFEILEYLTETSVYFPKVQLVFSVHSDPEYIVKAMKLGASNYIVKEDKDDMTAFERLLNTAKEELRKKGYTNEPDYGYIHEHFDEWREKYHNEYLAFINGLLVAHGPNKKRLIETVKEKYPDEIPYIMLSPRSL